MWVTVYFTCCHHYIDLIQINHPQFFLLIYIYISFISWRDITPSKNQKLIHKYHRQQLISSVVQIKSYQGASRVTNSHGVIPCHFFWQLFIVNNYWFLQPAKVAPRLNELIDSDFFTKSSQRFGASSVSLCQRIKILNWLSSLINMLQLNCCVLCMEIIEYSDKQDMVINK